MAAETAVMVTIATSLASGILKEVAKKAVDAASESTMAVGLRSAISGSLEADLHRLENELQKLTSVLYCAQNIDPMHYDKNNLLLKWMGQLKEAVCYADNLLDEIAYEKIRRSVQIQTSLVVRLYARSDTSFLFRMRISGKFKKFASLTAEIHKEAQSTLNLSQLAGIALTANNQQKPPTLHENLRELRENPDTLIVMGREVDQELIVNSLCTPHKDHTFHVVAIVGISGVGKTTLARMVYENETVREYFGRRTWIFVSDNFGLNRFLDEMLQAITGKSHGLTNINAMEDLLKQCLQEEKKGYLLVLDDVWNEDEQLWKLVESLLVRVTFSTRCTVLVTTQSSRVARLMCASPTHELKDLSDYDAWVLFKRLAFAQKTQKQSSDLEDVGRRILRKCKGLPLAIRTMGSLLGSMSEKSEWESIERSEIWGLSLDQSKIMPWLLISFNHIQHAAVKQCFVHCSITMEKGQTVQQSDLVQAWMAQGFIQSPRGSDKRIDKIGDTYVSNLVANGLLQVFTVSNFRCLKMHDLVHDLASYIFKDTIWASRASCDLNAATKAEHVRISGEGNLVSVYSLTKDMTLSKLRTLICTRATLCIDFGAQAKFLRDLRLIDCELWEIPNSIGKLKHLRYLSLRGNPFSDLPESIGTLFNLQTLDLTQCDNIHHPSQGIAKLADLCGVQKPKVNIIMPGMMECLRFELKYGFEMKEVMSLESHIGDVEMLGLHLITCKEVDVVANISKARIRNLLLNWGPFEERLVDDERVMDGLRPHSNLKGITVIGFAGKRLSSWILHMNNLKTIVMKGCKHCEQLLALGQLASLEKLEIDKMESLQVIGVEFYYNDEGRANNGRILFPYLHELILKNMQKLRYWVEPSGHEIFPRLKRLEIRDCPLLSSAPTCLSNLSNFFIANIISVEAVRMILTNNNDSLKLLDISGVEDLTFLFPHELLRGNNKSDDILNFQSLTRLHQLHLINFPHQMSIPECLGCLPNLWYLEMGGFNEELVQLDGAANLPKSLTYLKLWRWPKIQCLPSELQRLNRLLMLTMIEFESIERLPDWLGDLSYLQTLLMEDCKNLEYLPSQDAMRCLTYLEAFVIKGCPILEKRCTGDGEYYENSGKNVLFFEN